MSSDGGLFPSSAGDGRYSARPPHKIWTPQEDLLLYPIAYSCLSERAYLATCVRLCELLERKPAYDEKHKPTRKEIVDDSASIIRLRTMQRGLSGEREEVIPLAWKVFRGKRTGKEVTYGERRIADGMPRKTNGRVIGRHDLLALFDRGDVDAALDDPAPIREYLDVEYPLSPRREIEAMLRIRNWLATDLKDRDSLRRRWAELCDFMGGQ